MFLSTRLSRHTLPLALVLGLASVAPALARPTPAAGPATTTASISSIRIENFGRVSPSLYRGAQPGDRDYADLAALGVRTVIDLQEADGDPNEPNLVRAAGMTYYRIPMSTHRPPTTEQLAQFFRLVSNPSQPAYVHCKGGRHRTGVMTAAYRMAFDHWTPGRAFSEMKQYKFGADFLHPEFKNYVYGFDVSRAPIPAVAATTQQQN